MIEIEINNAEQVLGVLQKIAKATQRRTDLMRNIAGTMESAVKQNFQVGGRPTWLGLKYRDGRTLIKSEALSESIGSAYDNDNAIVGTNMEYAAIHQFGGKAGRGGKVDIPARPFLSLTEQDEEDILECVQDYFARLIK